MLNSPKQTQKVHRQVRAVSNHGLSLLSPSPLPQRLIQRCSVNHTTETHEPDWNDLVGVPKAKVPLAAQVSEKSQADEPAWFRLLLVPKPAVIPLCHIAVGSTDVSSERLIKA